MLKKILSESDITELKNIVDCLKSKDKETYNLGLSLLILKFGNDFWVPVLDKYVPFKFYLECLQYPDYYNYCYKFDKEDVGIKLLENIIFYKSYAISSNN